MLLESSPPNKNFFHQQTHFFANFVAFSPSGVFFSRQVGSLIRKSLRSQVSCSPLESLLSNRTASSLQFFQPNFKLLSLSAQLERNTWQILAAVCSGGTLSSPAPFQVDDRWSCSVWHRRARQSLDQIPVTDLFLA